MEKFEQKVELWHSPEVMKIPEIVIQEEHGAQLFSLLLKAENPQWGETETPLAKETTEYFASNPLPSGIIEAIHQFQSEGVDEETLYNLALTYQHPERAQHVLEMAAKYKPHVKNPEEKYKQFLGVIESIDRIFSASPLASKFASEIEVDREARLDGIEAAKARIQKIIDFFRPDPHTAEIRKVSFVPTDPLYRKNSGRAFAAFPGEKIVISHIDNVLNQDHEFSHGFINPIVEKLSEHLTEEQKQKVSKLASETLKQDYGEGHFSLLCEEFIRTYTELVGQDGKPQTREDFVEKVSDVTEEQFQEILQKERGFKKRCDELQITTADDFKNRAGEYFDKFKKNDLRDIIFNLYGRYEARPDKTINFEQFVISEFPTLLENR